MTEELEHSLFQNVLFPVLANTQSGTSDLCLRKTIRFAPDPNLKITDATLVVFDFETTGLDSVRDRLIEVGAQKIKNNKVIDEISTLIHTDLEIPEVVQKLTGITADMLEGKPSCLEVIPKFLEFIRGSLLVAHNADFDMGFLRAECSRQGIDLDWPAFCTLKLARELLPDLERKNLDTLAEHYELTFESRHRSIGDVKVTTSVLNEMMANEGSYIKSWRDMKPFSVTPKA